MDEKGKRALHKCPYDAAVTCNLEEPCLGCETFGEYLNKLADKDFLPPTRMIGEVRESQEWNGTLIPVLEAVKVTDEWVKSGDVRAWPKPGITKRSQSTMPITEIFKEFGTVKVNPGSLARRLFARVKELRKEREQIAKSGEELKRPEGWPTEEDVDEVAEWTAAAIADLEPGAPVPRVQSEDFRDGVRQCLRFTEETRRLA
jgi:hypothetical protein